MYKKGDNSKFILARIMPLFGLRTVSEKAATAEHLRLHAVLFSYNVFSLKLKLFGEWLISIERLDISGCRYQEKER